MYYRLNRLKMKYWYTIIAIISITGIGLAAVNAKRTKREPIALNEESWTQLLRGEWMVDFYAPWCPACKSLEPEWRKFAEWSDDLNINVASADVTANPGLSGRFMVSGLPTIYHVKDGVFRQYNGAREHTSLINFVEEQGWKKIDPISRWRAPESLQMSFVAYSFRASMALRDLHNYLVDQKGLPSYLSYTIFALCTVTLGTVLGLVIVFIVDQFGPSRHAGAPQPATRQAGGPSTKRRKNTDKNDSDLEDSEARTPATNKGDGRKQATESVRRRANK